MARADDAGYSYGGKASAKSAPSHKGMGSPEVTKGIEKRNTTARDLKYHEQQMEEMERRKSAFEKQRKGPAPLPKGWSPPPPSLADKMAQRKDLLAKARKTYGPPKQVKTSKVPFSVAIKHEMKERSRQENEREYRDYMDRRSRGERDA